MTSQLYRNRLMAGIYSRVARNLSLGPNGRSTVRRVANGERTSARVEAALLAELRRVDSAVLRFERKLARVQISGGVSKGRAA